ncbi:YxiG-like protein [Micromonospora chersina]
MSGGGDFHEIRFEMNGHNHTLILGDLEVTRLPIGYAPFRVTEGK